ncbi:hypothetical protein Bca101_084150 [Brassica carinata]
MDPAEERRETKRLKEYYDSLGYVADSQYGIPGRCLCGGRIIDEGDGLHYRHPWVHGVQEELEKLTRRVEEAEQEQVKNLAELVDHLTWRITDLERLCFD